MTTKLDKIVDKVVPGKPVVINGFGHTVTFVAWEGKNSDSPGCDVLFDGKKWTHKDEQTTDAYGRWLLDMGLFGKA